MTDISILTATYNRHDFTVNMLASLSNTLGYFPKNVVVLDNSDKIKFPKPKPELIRLIDNTNFKITKDYGQPSKNHCSSLECALSTIETKYVMLCDNDILFKPSIKELLNDYQNYDLVGEIGYDIVPPNRLFPYLCIIDMEFYRRNGLHYFDENRCIRGNYYDTGASFLIDAMKFDPKIKRINLKDYIVHLKGGTLHNKTLASLVEHERT